MLSFFKKLFTKQPVVVNEEDELYSKLLEMVHYEKLHSLMYSPVNKLYILNTYTADFNDLISNLYNSHFHRQIIAINIHSYFQNSKVDIQNDLERITKCLRDHKPNAQLQHDLHEIVNAFEYFKSMEK